MTADEAKEVFVMTKMSFPRQWSSERPAVIAMKEERVS
jgi:hypothetical protein